MSYFAKIVVYGVTVIIAVLFLNFKDLSVKENLWQYAMIVIALLGAILNATIGNYKESFRLRLVVLIIVMASVLLITQVVYSLVNRTWELLLSTISMGLLIIGLSISLKEIKRSK